MGWIDRWRERRAARTVGMTQQELSQFLDGGGDVTREEAMAIPAIAGAVEFIAAQASALPLRLYKEVDGKITEVRDDPRLAILNDDTGDLMSGVQWKRAAVADYLLEGRAYLYRQMRGNRLMSLHYVPAAHVHVRMGTDLIHKQADIMVQGQMYRVWDFVRITRSSRDGVTGRGILQECEPAIRAMVMLQKYQKIMVSSGGNRRGIFQAKRKLDGEMFAALKEMARKIYSGDSTEAMVLNEGITFTQTSATPMEMQLTQLSDQLDQGIWHALNLPGRVLEGGGDGEIRHAVMLAVQPVLAAMEAAINKDLLLEREKGRMFFAFDRREMMQGDVASRYAALREAIGAGWMTINEARYQENMDPIPGMDVLGMGLGDVIYDVQKQTYFVPNLAGLGTVDTQKGGTGDGDQSQR